MAIYHLAINILGRMTSNAVHAAAYRAAERLVCQRTGTVKNFRYKREVSHREIGAPSNAPTWARERPTLWNAVEKAERRKDAQVARECLVALPCELTKQQHIDLLRGYVEQAFVSMGMVADWCIHNKPGNPHCHILLTMRDIGPKGFSTKNRAWNDPRLVETWRLQWEETCNAALAKAGSDARIDRRTLAAQGISRAPTRHLGRDNGLNSVVLAESVEYNDLQHAKADLARIQKEQEAVERELAALDSEIIDLKTTLAQALAERRMPESRHSDSGPVFSLDEANQMRCAQPPPGGLILPWDGHSHTAGAMPALNPTTKETPSC